MNGTKQVAQRMVNAENLFIENVMEIAKISKEDAEKVFQVYLKEKIIKLDAVMGVYKIMHGAFYEMPVIKRAIDLFNVKIKAKKIMNHVLNNS